MTTGPAVSVIIPSGGIDRPLLQQVSAVLAQRTDSSFELIVALNLDPGVPPDAGLERSLLGHEAVRVVHATGQRSAAHARNVGAAAASAPILAFCDADDVARQGWLAALLAAMNDNEVVGGRLVEFADHGDLPAWRPPATPGALPLFLGVPYVVSANLAITRAAFERVGGFDESLTRCEDIAISWMLIKAGYELAFADDAVIDYRVRGTILDMLRQHYLYGVGMSEVLVRIGRPGASDSDARSFALLRPNNQAGGLRSPIGVLRKLAIGAGRLKGLVQERSR